MELPNEVTRPSAFHLAAARTGIVWWMVDGSVSDECLRMAETHGTPAADLTALREAAALVAVTELNIWSYVYGARRKGSSWTAIGQALGISRQAARQRFGSADRSRYTAPTDLDTERIWATATGPATAARPDHTAEEGLSA